jgi:predicted N-acetyltransferase YhbS
MSEPTDFHFRNATPGDAWSLRQLIIESFSEKIAKNLAGFVLTSQSREDILPLLEHNSPGAMLIAEEDSRICGAVSLFPPDASGSEVWMRGAYGLRHLAIYPQYRRTTLSQQLLARAEAAALQAGATGICVHIPSGSPGLSRLFMSRGYGRDPGGDFDRGSLAYLEGYYLALVDQATPTSA